MHLGFFSQPHQPSDIQISKKSQKGPVGKTLCTIILHCICFLGLKKKLGKERPPTEINANVVGMTVDDKIKRDQVSSLL